MESNELQIGNMSKLTENDFTLITRAHEEFNQKLYANCLQTLDSLEHSIGSNYNILHNKAIGKFYSNECKDYEQLLKVLNVEVDDEDVNCPTFSKSGNETTVVFNKACIYFHLKKYYTAIDILNPIAERIEELDESSASSVGILMLCLLLATNQLTKASAFLNVLQRHLNIDFDALLADTTISTDSFRRMFKLIAVMTHVVNKDPILIADNETVEWAILKAHQFYLGKDFQMASKQLSKKFLLDNFSIEVNGENHNTLIANNMGIIHLRVRHYAMASKFFQHALKFDKSVAENLKDVPLHQLSAPQTPEILYNLGIALLHLKRPRDAFKCFVVPLKFYYNNPRLWLRTAEACIMVYNLESLTFENKSILHPVLCGDNRRKFIITPTSFVNDLEHNPDEIASTLEFAANCLTNALSLVKSYRSKFASDEDVAEEACNQHWTQNVDHNYCNPSMPINREALDNMEAAIYAASSYVALKTADYVRALTFARTLLELNNLSDSYKMIGRHYCAEALVHLDKIHEATPLLDPNLVSILDPYDLETKVWSANSVEAAQSITKYNLAVTLAIQGDHTGSLQMLTTCKHPIVANKVRDLKTYFNVIGFL